MSPEVIAASEAPLPLMTECSTAMPYFSNSLASIAVYRWMKPPDTAHVATLTGISGCPGCARYGFAPLAAGALVPPAPVGALATGFPPALGGWGGCAAPWLA